MIKVAETVPIFRPENFKIMIVQSNILNISANDAPYKILVSLFSCTSKEMF